MNKRFAALLFALNLAFVGTHPVAAAVGPEQAAQTGAEQWLALVDAGRYPESWDSMAAAFKEQVSKRKWNSTITGIRKPLGKTISRKLKSAEFTKDLPGAPEGEYVVVRFDVVFEKKPAAVETVTTVLGQDLIWRASGYAVK